MENTEQQQQESEFKVLLLNARNSVAEIRRAEKSAKDRETEVATYLSKFLELKDSAENPETGIAVILERAKATKAEIDNIKNESQSHFDSIQSNASSVAQKVEEIEKFYSETFLDLKKKIEDPESGLAATLSFSKEYKEQILQTKIVGDDLVRQIKNDQVSANAFKAEAESSREKIDEIKKESESIKSSIFDLLKISQDQTLADAFAKRKDELKWSLGLWLFLTIISTTALGLLTYYIVESIVDEWELFWMKLTFLPPLIFAVIFSAGQYNKERNLIEQYSFKFAIGFSLQSYTKLLWDRFNKDEERGHLLKFVISSIEKVYENPHTVLKSNKQTALKMPTSWKLPLIGDVTINPAMEHTESPSDQKAV